MPFDRAWPVTIVGTRGEVSPQIETAFKQLRFNEVHQVHLPNGQAYLEKNAFISELELFANKVMPR